MQLKTAIVRVESMQFKTAQGRLGGVCQQIQQRRLGRQVVFNSDVYVEGEVGRQIHTHSDDQVGRQIHIHNDGYVGRQIQYIIQVDIQLGRQFLTTMIRYIDLQFGRQIPSTTAKIVKQILTAMVRQIVRLVGRHKQRWLDISVDRYQQRWFIRQRVRQVDLNSY